MNIVDVEYQNLFAGRYEIAHEHKFRQRLAPLGGASFYMYT